MKEKKFVRNQSSHNHECNTALQKLLF